MRSLFHFSLLLACGWLAVASSALAQSQALPEFRTDREPQERSYEVSPDFINSLTPAERANLHGFVPPAGFEQILEDHRKVFTVRRDLPVFFDWRNEDGITPVKSQGECGSCWAFAATAEMESFVKIYYGMEMNLSEQQVVSCNPYGANCSGGWTGAAYYVFLAYGGINEHCMVYQAEDPPEVPCDQVNHIPYVWLTGWHSVSNNVEQIKTALLDGPVSSLVDASANFEDYSGGCYNDPASSSNHVILIVGWDDRLCDGAGGWIIKNSWGTDWGMSGYGYVQYGTAYVGHGCTQLEYTPPPVTIDVTSPLGADHLMGESWTDITWNTSGGAVSSVDIWYGSDNFHMETLLGEDVPNTGTFSWWVPNEATDSGRIAIFPHTGTSDGYGFSPEPITVIGHKVRYVSAAGSNTPPYESPATAAHTINDAVLACTGLDSVMIAADEYLETVTISSTIQLFGGWDSAFTLRDPETQVTGLRGVNSAIRFFDGAGDFGAVDGIRFHDCAGGYYSQPTEGEHGGAIYSLNASPTISNCLFEYCRAAPGGALGYGGAIMALGGSPVIENCTFQDNIGACGGAVALLDPIAASLSGNDFRRNACSDSLGTNLGAALYVSGGQVSLSGDVFLNNGGSANGGGIYLLNADLTGQDVQLTGNRSQSAGGGIWAENSQLDLIRGNLTGNLSASNGGGLNTIGGGVFLRNLLFTGNQASNMGAGGMMMTVASGCVENCLFTGNTATILGGGLFVSAAGPYTVRNSMIVQNTGGGLSAMGAELVADYNNVWDNTGGDYPSGAPGPNDVNLDPLLVDPAGGDYGLGLHSPCLDRGEPDPLCLDPDGSPADIGMYGGSGAQTVAPAAIAGANIQDEGGGLFTLSWTPNTEPDMAQYVIYRDSTQVFEPDPAKVVATLPHPTATWQDNPPHSCYYLIVAVDTDGHVGGYSIRLPTTTTAVGGPGLPTALDIAGVVPNPFNPRTTIWYDVPRASQVSLRVYDLRGRLVRQLVNGQVQPGRHSVDWLGRDEKGAEVASGVYLVRVLADGLAVTKKVALAR